MAVLRRRRELRSTQDGTKVMNDPVAMHRMEKELTLEVAREMLTLYDRIDIGRDRLNRGYRLSAAAWRYSAKLGKAT